VVEQLDGVERGDGPVVEVTGDEHGIDLLATGRVDHEVDHGGLGVEEGRAVEVAAQVPVGGVEEAHESDGTNAL
jgi:hypothetical protein